MKKGPNLGSHNLKTLLLIIQQLNIACIVIYLYILNLQTPRTLLYNLLFKYLFYKRSQKSRFDFDNEKDKHWTLLTFYSILFLMFYRQLHDYLQMTTTKKAIQRRRFHIFFICQLLWGTSTSNQYIFQWIRSWIGCSCLSFLSNMFLIHEQVWILYRYWWICLISHSLITFTVLNILEHCCDCLFNVEIIMHAWLSLTNIQTLWIVWRAHIHIFHVNWFY